MWGTKIKDLPFKLVVQSEIEIWRAADFWTKEPETIAWIDSFEPVQYPRPVFWDIGANIGLYSLYAAMINGFEVDSFEPEINNFNRITENKKLNKRCFKDYEKSCTFRTFSHFNYAISDFDGKSTFYVPKSGPGRSGGQIGKNSDESGREFQPEESYEVETYRIDTLAQRFGVPNHIKIDVDGNELKILQGGIVTLSDVNVKSVLVEVNNCYADINGFMKSIGFSDFNRFNGPDINRRATQKARNVIYVR